MVAWNRRTSYQTYIHFRVGSSCFIGNARTESTVVKNHGGPTVVRPASLFPSRLRLLRDYLLSMDSEVRHESKVDFRVLYSQAYSIYACVWSKLAEDSTTSGA